MTRFEFALQVLESGADLYNVSFYWDHWQDLTRTPSLSSQPSPQLRFQPDHIVNPPLPTLSSPPAAPVSLFKEVFEAPGGQSDTNDPAK